MEKRDRFSSRRRFAGTEDEATTVDSLAEALNAEINADDFQPIEETNDSSCIGEDASIVAEAEAFINSLEAAELPDDEQVVENCDFAKECSEVESMIDAAEEKEEDAAETASVLAECEAVEASIRNASAREQRRASIYKKGIEDEIRDTAGGLEKTVSELPSTKIKTNTRKEVFGKGTNSAYVASITKRLDRVATILEKRGDLRMAFRVDRLADALEQEIKKH